MEFQDVPSRPEGTLWARLAKSNFQHLGGRRWLGEYPSSYGSEITTLTCKWSGIYYDYVHMNPYDIYVYVLSYLPLTWKKWWSPMMHGNWPMAQGSTFAFAVHSVSWGAGWLLILTHGELGWYRMMAYLNICCYHVFIYLYSNVVKTIVNHPPISPNHHHFYMCYVYHSQMAGLWLCVDHITRIAFGKVWKAKDWRGSRWNSEGPSISGESINIQTSRRRQGWPDMWVMRWMVPSGRLT